MDVVFESLPFLHPIAVHFPVALVSAALFCMIVWAATGGRFWRLTILFLLSAGLAGSAFAYLTGEAVPESAVEPAAEVDLLTVHTTSATYSLTFTGLALIVLVALNFYLERRTTLRRHPPDPPWVRMVVGLFVLAAWAATAFAGYSGHLLVWGAG